MNVLPCEGDNAMTLQEALAFIDPSDDIDRNNATLPPLEETDELLGSVMGVLLEETTSLDGKAQKPTTKQERTTTTTPTKTAATEKTMGKKKRVRSPASSSTVLQRRKKAEILSLRQQATELQTLLNQLLSPDASSAVPKLNVKTCADSKARGQRPSQWQRSALEQYEMRCKSQQLNRQLKKIASQQRSTTISLRAILRRQSLVQDMNNVMKHESPEHLFGPLADNGVHRCMAQLAHAVDSMYQHPTPIFGSAPSVSSHVQTSYKEQRKGDVVAFITSTPMRCSMADASNVVWSHFVKEQPLHVESKPNVLHSTEPVTLHHLDESLQFEKLHYLRKISEPGKVTLVYSAILLLHSEGLKFCINGLTTIMPLPADPLHTCAVHTVVKLHVDKKTGQESPFAQDIALGALSKAVRLYRQSEQSSLVDEAARVSGEPSYFML
ncbi:uncharacterized protein KRP23_12141 [Phytophthora ramorum]|uniref:uncharacterized protein n=1 Tax=Phytophthora ramorum TaxID=164328 RepID=UPI00309B90AD|nr:hypothetical protein KRP23_12141 [Phytophthora ramorum]